MIKLSTFIVESLFLESATRIFMCVDHIINGIRIIALDSNDKLLRHAYYYTTYDKKLTPFNYRKYMEFFNKTPNDTYPEYRLLTREQAKYYSDMFDKLGLQKAYLNNVILPDNPLTFGGRGYDSIPRQKIFTWKEYIDLRNKLYKDGDKINGGAI